MKKQGSDYQVLIGNNDFAFQ